MDKELIKLKDIDFSIPQLNESYQLGQIEVDTSLNGLLAVPQQVIDSCFSDDILPPGFKDELSNNETSIDDIVDKFVNDWEDFLDQDQRFLAAIACGFVIAILLPLTGLFCCCRCCCCSKNKYRQPSQRKRSWIKVCGITLLGLIASIGFVWSFAGVARVKSSDFDLVQTLDQTFDDIDLFIQNVETEFDYLLLNNFNETVHGFHNEIDSLTVKFEDELNHLLDAIHFNDITDEAEKMVKFVDEYSNILTLIKDIEVQIQGIKDNCPGIDLCNEINQILDQVEAPLKAISNVGFDKEAINQAKMIETTLQNIKTDIDSILSNFKNDYFEQIDAQIVDIQKTLSEQSNEIKDTINDLPIHKDDIGLDYDSWGDFQSPVLISLLVFVLILVPVVILMLVPFFNIPRVMAGIYLVLGFLYFLAIVVFFTVGSLGEVVVCKMLEEPESSEILPLLDQTLQSTLKDAFGMEAEEKIDITMVGVLQGIKNEMPLYPLLELSHLYNITDLQVNWIEEYGISTYIDEAKDQLDATINSVIEYESQFSEVEQIFESISTQVDEILNEQMPLLSNFDIDQLFSGISDNIPIIQEEITNLKTDFKEIQNSLTESLTFIQDKDGKYQLNEETSKLIKMFRSAFEYIKGTGKQELQEFLDDSIASIIGVVQSFLDFAVDSVNTRIASTKPFNNMINALDVLVCEVVIDSLNLAWTGLGWTCLLLFFPMSFWVLWVLDWPFVSAPAKNRGTSSKQRQNWKEPQDLKNKSKRNKWTED